MDKIERRVQTLKDENAPRGRISQQKLNGFGLTDITLRSYQLDGVNWLIDCYNNEHGCILGDEMGLGKTCQTISLLVYLVASQEERIGPHLVLSPLSVLNNWKSELSRFAPHLEVLTYVGDKNAREELRQKLKKKLDKIHVVLTTYETCLNDETFLKKYSWHALVVDEAHRLKNRESLLHQALCEFDVSHTVLLTGTPVQNNLTELYSLLHFIIPELFKVKYMEDFLEAFEDVQTNSKKMNKLHDLLLPFILRRVKSQVMKDLPSKSEMILFHGMTTLQKKYYRAMLMKDTSIFKTNSYGGNRTKLMNVLMQLRKCVNHPYLFEGVEPEPFELGEHLVEASGKLVLIDQLLTYLEPLGHKVLLFSQMTRMLDILQDYLGYRGINYERLDGSVRGEERYLAVQNFNSDDDTFVFLLSTKAGGQGLNLVSADTVIFVDSDFNPQNDLQAAARAHRIGQKRPVKVIRLVGRSTVDEVILKRAEAKLKLTETVIEKGNFSLGVDVADKESLIASSKFKIQDILKFGVDKLFADEESTVENVDFDQILGPTKNGEWTEVTNNQEQASLAATSMEVDDEISDENDNKGSSMYVYEGTDYSQLADEDIETFRKLLSEKEEEEELDEEEESGRGKRRTSEAGTSKLVDKPRKKLSPEELEKRRKRRAELAAQREKEEEEEERRRAEKRKNRLLALWKKNNYVSLKIELGSEEEESASEEEEESEELLASDINYVVGDVTRPKVSGDAKAYVIHCVDDSGSWGYGGVFSALSKVSSEPEKHYEQAGEMKDLSLGDVHLVPLSGDQVQVALIVAQTRNRKGELTGIKLPALGDALRYLAHAAKKNKASVHLPRIGHNTPAFNWYGTERLIRKCLVSKGINTSIYYYKQRQPVKRRISSSSESEEDVPAKKAARSPPKPGPFAPSVKNYPATKGLPDFMSAVTVYFHEVPESERKVLSRYLIAYDGDVCSDLNDTTTHIVTEEGVDCLKSQKIQKHQDEFPGLVITTISWLKRCFKQQKKLQPT